MVCSPPVFEITGYIPNEERTGGQEKGKMETAAYLKASNT